MTCVGMLLLEKFLHSIEIPQHRSEAAGSLSALWLVNLRVLLIKNFWSGVEFMYACW